MSNLGRATFRVLHSLRRKAAGEHHVQTTVIIDAFASEWMLKPSEIATLYRVAVDEEQQIRLRRRA